MKIFVVGPEYRDFFTHNVAITCRAMGFDVCSDAKSTSLVGKSSARLIGEELLAKSAYWRRYTEQQIVAAAVEFKPNLTIVCTKTLEPETVHTIRRRTAGRVVCWFGDTPGNLKRDHVTSGEYDAVFVKDKRFAADLRNVLQLNAFHLHEACNKLWHRPVPVVQAGHIAVAGTLYGYRVAVIRNLLLSGWSVECFGPQPSGWVDKQVVATHRGIFLDHTNKSTEFGRALACLNTFAPAERDSLNCRIFETCGCGGMLISEHKSAMDECFDPYEEYLPFTSIAELLEQLDRLKSDRKAGEQIRRNAARRAHAQHTYEHRIGFILSTLAR